MVLRLAAVTLTLLAPAALASRLVPGTLADRAALAQRIVFAQVTSTRTLPREGRPGALTTVTQVVVAQNLKGEGPDRISVNQVGGVLGGVDARIPGDASFTPGENVILLLKCPHPDFCALVALGEGKLTVQGTAALQRDLNAGQWRLRPLDEVLAELGSAPLGGASAGTVLGTAPTPAALSGPSAGTVLGTAPTPTATVAAPAPRSTGAPLAPTAASKPPAAAPTPAAPPAPPEAR